MIYLKDGLNTTLSLELESNFSFGFGTEALDPKLQCRPTYGTPHPASKRINLHRFGAQAKIISTFSLVCLDNECTTGRIAVQSPMVSTVSTRSTTRILLPIQAPMQKYHSLASIQQQHIVLLVHWWINSPTTVLNLIILLIGFFGNWIFEEYLWTLLKRSLSQFPSISLAWCCRSGNFWVLNDAFSLWKDPLMTIDTNFFDIVIFLHQNARTCQQST